MTHRLLQKMKTMLSISTTAFDDNLNLILEFGENYIKDKLDVEEEKWVEISATNNIVDLAIMLYAKQLFVNNVKDKFNNDYTPILDKAIKSLLIRIERD